MVSEDSKPKQPALKETEERSPKLIVAAPPAASEPPSARAVDGTEAGARSAGTIGSSNTESNTSRTVDSSNTESNTSRTVDSSITESNTSRTVDSSSTASNTSRTVDSSNTESNTSRTVDSSSTASNTKRTTSSSNTIYDADEGRSVNLYGSTVRSNQVGVPTINVPALGADDEPVTLEYKPYAGAERWVKYRFSAWSSYKAWFAMGLIVLFFGFGGPGFILDKVTDEINKFSQDPVRLAQLHAPGGYSAPAESTIPVLFLLLAGVAGLAAARYLSHPTHVKLSRESVSLLWKRGKLSDGTFSIPWSNISEIKLVWPAEKTSPQDSIVKFLGPNKQKIALRLGSIPTVDERHKLLKCIDRWGSEIPRDAELMDILTPPSDGSYTELWLQALSAPPKRERLTPLPPDAVLQEGKYIVGEALGVGGQGTAYVALRAADNMDVVLKEFILPVYVDVNVRRQSLENMQHEASMLRRLNNERIVKLIDFFVEDHRGYLVLERISGHSLRQVVQNTGAMTESRVVDLARQMCSMLIYLHSLTPPVVHRDFTPDNLILSDDGILKLVDFNVAQQTESTATGTVVGKQAYLPPEQFRGKPTTQSDVYAMGATLYYLLVGTDPEPITCSHPKKQREYVSDQLDALIAHSTVLDARQRIASADAFANELDNLHLPPPSV